MTDADAYELTKWQASNAGLAEAATHSLGVVVADLERMATSREGLQIMRAGFRNLTESEARLRLLLDKIFPNAKEAAE